MSKAPQFAIPADWKIHQLAELGTPVRGGSPRPAGDPRFFNGSYIPWLTVASLTGIPDTQLTVKETASYLTQEGSFRSRTLNPGTLIIANSGATLGIAKILGIQCCANDGIAALINPTPDIDLRYLAYFINTQTKFLRDVVATGNGQPNLNTGLIGAINIPIPSSIDEQRKIADTLSEIDDLIRGLDQLIAKKRNIQQAAMQQLLTGQRRLPGFSGAWVVKRLGEIGEVSGAGVDKKIRTGETEIRLLNYTDVYKKDFLRSSDFNHVVTAKPEQIARCAVKKGDIFFTPSSETRDDIGHASVSCEDMPDVAYSYHVVRLRPLPALDIKFLGFVFKSKDFSDQASVACEGSGTRYVITLPKFRAMTIRLPLGIDEQEAIGEVLFDMGNELAALEARRDKARQLKQGMMQELLTGRIRLV